MGLLDLNWDALNSDQGRMALGLLAAAGPQERPMSFGQRLAGAMDQFRSQKAAEDERKQRAQQQALQTQLVQMQLAQAKAQQEQQQRALTNEDAFRNLLPSPQMQASSDALAGGGGPTVGNAANIKPVDPMAQLSYEAMKYGQIKPTDYLASLRKDTTPMKVGRDDRLIDPVTKRVVLDALPKEEATPADWKLYQLSGAQQRGIGFDQWDQARKRAGATNVSVSMDKGFGDTFAKDAAGFLAKSRDQATASANTLRTLDRIDSVMRSGNVITGPLATPQLVWSQIADALKIGGKDNAEKLANTAQLIKSSADLALDGAARMAGQGQITEAERALINKASGGGIDSMTVPEIRGLMGALRKVNAANINQHQDNMKKVGPEFQKFAPFYQVDIPKSSVIDFGSLP